MILPSSKFKAFSSFWKKYPALFLGLGVFLGTSLAFQFHFLLIILLFLLGATAASKKDFLGYILCAVLGFFNGSQRCPTISLPEEKIVGSGVFHIEEIKNTSSPFARSLLYKGTLRTFESFDLHLKNIPCHIYLPSTLKRPPGNVDYTIKGALIQKENQHFVLKPDKKEKWVPLYSFLNLSEWRFRTKQAFSHYLKNQIANPHAFTFLNALATGEILDRTLSMEFGKMGLQHLLAISGFHFAIAAVFFNLILRLFLPDKLNALLLLCFLSFYYLLLGNAPSIQRAYLAIFFVIFGKLFSLKSSSLNVLGAALMIEVLMTPQAVTELGFQLTFLCTLAILLFYPIFKSALTLLLPKHPYSQTQEMSLLNKHGALLSTLLRNLLAVNFAVHVISIPVLLYLFHKFPLLSFGYNLFFPHLVIFSMILLYLALLLAPFAPFLSHLIHQWNNGWTTSILTFTSNPPVFLDFSIRTNHLSFVWIVSYLSIAFFVGVFFYEREQSRLCTSLCP